MFFLQNMNKKGLECKGVFFFPLQNEAMWIRTLRTLWSNFFVAFKHMIMASAAAVPSSNNDALAICFPDSTKVIDDTCALLCMCMVVHVHGCACAWLCMVVHVHGCAWLCMCIAVHVQPLQHCEVQCVTAQADRVHTGMAMSVECPADSHPRWPSSLTTNADQKRRGRARKRKKW